jgi:hypothetical protein
MMPARKTNKAELAWKAAEAALEAARQLPAGIERCEALKKAGKLRFDADVDRSHEVGPGKSGIYSND